VPKAAAFNSISTDTFVRKYSHLIRRVSEGRVGVYLGDVLDIAKPINDA
jgi:predicted nucleotidyltransferase